MATKGMDERGQASVPTKAENPPLEVESPRIESLMKAVFGVSSPEAEKGEGKNVEGGISLGHEKQDKEPSFALETDTVGPAHFGGKEIDEELGFFVRNLARDDLSEEKASKLEEQTEAMCYSSGAMIFCGVDNVLMCVLDAGKAKIVKNVTRSISFPEIEAQLSQLKKRKLSQRLAYTSIKVKPFLF